VCCSVLQCVAVCCSRHMLWVRISRSFTNAVCCSVLQCVAVYSSVLQRVAVCVPGGGGGGSGVCVAGEQARVANPI